MVAFDCPPQQPRLQPRPRPHVLLLVLLGVLLLGGTVTVGATPRTRGASSGARVREGTKTEAPIIGIFTQPSHDTVGDCGGYCDYIAASYVKWVEAAGGRALPIPYNASAALLDVLFGRMNGLLLPGGGNPLPEAAAHMLGRAVAAHEAGEYFPVWCTCLGMEWLMQALGGEEFELEVALDAWNVSLPLEYTEEAAQSRLFKPMDPVLFTAAGTEPLTMNNHHKGASPARFLGDARLAATFNVLSTNMDRIGQPFVSTIEGKGGLPIWGVQWHPEKNVFEWGTVPDPTTGAPLAYEAINHSAEAQALSQYTGQFFVACARRSAHRFPSAAEEEAVLMYNFGAVATGPEFVQKYYFKSYPAVYDMYEKKGGQRLRRRGDDEGRAEWE